MHEDDRPFESAPDVRDPAKVGDTATTTAADEDSDGDSDLDALEEESPEWWAHVNRPRPPTRPAWPAPRDGMPAVRIFSGEEVDAYAAIFAAEIKEPDERKTVELLIAHLRATGMYRHLPPLHRDWRHRLDALDAAFPNFCE